MIWGALLLAAALWACHLYLARRSVFTGPGTRPWMTRKRAQLFSLGAGILLVLCVLQARNRHGNADQQAGMLVGAAGTGGLLPVQLGEQSLPPATVATYHNNNARTGQNVTETTLTPANVSASSFGKLHSFPVDGYIYSQPLYIPQVAIPGNGIHNIVVVATQHDSVYAFDSDSASTAPLWRVSFIKPDAGITTMSSADSGATDIVPEIGITSTPVIDVASNTVYVVAATKENGGFYHRLHALDLTSGAEKFAGPQPIQASYPGTAPDGAEGIVAFHSRYQLQRAALLLSSGKVYVAFASNADFGPYHGWVVAYDATTLRQVGSWVTTPNGYQGGIWMSGCGIATDSAGSMYLSVANGPFDATGETPGPDFGDSVVRLTHGANGITLADFFTPYNQAAMAKDDLDLGSAGVAVLPDQPGRVPHLLLTSAKNGHIYLLNRDNMGGYNAGGNRNPQVVQELSGILRQQMGTPAYWNGYVYFGAGISPGFDSIRAFTLRNGRLSAAPVSATRAVYKLTRSTVSISANGTANGIVWAVETDAYYGIGRHGPAVLHAYDAKNLARELYNSNQRLGRDNPGPAAKFTVPTIADGKVFVGTANQLSVYGLLAGR